MHTMVWQFWRVVTGGKTDCMDLLAAGWVPRSKFHPLQPSYRNFLYPSATIHEWELTLRTASINLTGPSVRHVGVRWFDRHGIRGNDPQPWKCTESNREISMYLVKSISSQHRPQFDHIRLSGKLGGEIPTPQHQPSEVLIESGGNEETIDTMLTAPNSNLWYSPKHRDTHYLWSPEHNISQCSERPCYAASVHRNRTQRPAIVSQLMSQLRHDSCGLGKFDKTSIVLLIKHMFVIRTHAKQHISCLRTHSSLDKSYGITPADTASLTDQTIVK